MGNAVTGRSLTEVVFPILRFSQFRRQSVEAILTGLEEAYTLHMRHAIAVLIVDLVGEVDLVRE